jgi:hypothetical protein
MAAVYPALARFASGHAGFDRRARACQLSRAGAELSPHELAVLDCCAGDGILH